MTFQCGKFLSCKTCACARDHHRIEFNVYYPFGCNKSQLVFNQENVMQILAYPAEINGRIFKWVSRENEVDLWIRNVKKNKKDKEIVILLSEMYWWKLDCNCGVQHVLHTLRTLALPLNPFHTGLTNWKPRGTYIYVMPARIVGGRLLLKHTDETASSEAAGQRRIQQRKLSS